MKSQAEVRALHDHWLRQVARDQDEDRDISRSVLALDQLCWVLAHPYCIEQP